MIRDNLREREDGTGKRTVYQLISSEAVSLLEEGLDTAYSVLVLSIDDEVVTESAIAYDVSRRESEGIRILDELCNRRCSPEEAVEAASDVLGAVL